MSAVLLAVFNDYEAAERAARALVRDGFLRIASNSRPPVSWDGPAANRPIRLHGKCVQYFRTLLKGEDERHYRNSRQRVENGSSGLSRCYRVVRSRRHVRPRSSASPAADVVRHDLANHGWSTRLPSMRLLDQQSARALADTDCIYCRLFPGSSH